MCYGNSVAASSFTRSDYQFSNIQGIQSNTTIDRMKAAKDMCGPAGVKSFKDESTGSGGIGVGKSGVGVQGDQNGKVHIECNPESPPPKSCATNQAVKTKKVATSSNIKI